MTDKPENPPAFPFIKGRTMGGGPIPEPGMDLRDWFAGNALMSMLNAPQTFGEDTPEIAARYSYRFADAMLAERGRK